MAAPRRSTGRGAVRPANQECRAPIVVTDLDPLELDGLEDHDGWSEVAVSGSAIAADAEHVTFSRSTIANVRLTAANLRRLELTDVVVSNCDLAGAVLEELSLNRVAFTNCRLNGADLGGATLTDVRFTDCQLDEVGMRMVRAERLVVSGGTATKIDLYRAWANGSRWHDVDLTGAELSGAKFTRARLQGSTIVDVRGATALQGSIIDHEQVITVGLALIADAGIEIDETR
ncbi:pentapeptide repeat-containing protein [Aquihabitans sp. McL0605]|uniref:pentapeptide repeat-containing protein n=1 Tax=Aquihabitans sp. McL0605 TaxID=3415671 RepID=UPI003CEE8E41